MLSDGNAQAYHGSEQQREASRRVLEEESTTLYQADPQSEAEQVRALKAVRVQDPSNYAAHASPPSLPLRVPVGTVQTSQMLAGVQRLHKMPLHAFQEEEKERLQKEAQDDKASLEGLTIEHDSLQALQTPLPDTMLDVDWSYTDMQANELDELPCVLLCWRPTFMLAICNENHCSVQVLLGVSSAEGSSHITTANGKVVLIT